MVSKLLFGIIYTVGYFFVALLSTGGGHGNFYVLLPLIPWLLLFVPIFLFGKLEDLQKRIIFILVLAIHYGLLIMILSEYDYSADKGWVNNNFPFPALIWYLAGQLLIWTEFFNETFLKKQKTG